MLILGDKVPAIVVDLVFVNAVVHKDLVQRLQRQVGRIRVGSETVGFRPFLGNKGVEYSRPHHLALDLIAILNQRHGKGAAALQRVGRKLIKNLVVLGLLPLKIQFVLGIDGLEILDEQRQRALAAARVAHAVEHLAIGLFNGFFGQFLHGHPLGLLNDTLHGGTLPRSLGAAASGHGKHHYC